MILVGLQITKSTWTLIQATWKEEARPVGMDQTQVLQQIRKGGCTKAAKLTFLLCWRVVRLSIDNRDQCSYRFLNKAHQHACARHSARLAEIFFTSLLSDHWFSNGYQEFIFVLCWRVWKRKTFPRMSLKLLLRIKLMVRYSWIFRRTIWRRSHLVWRTEH